MEVWSRVSTIASGARGLELGTHCGASGAQARAGQAMSEIGILSRNTCGKRRRCWSRAVPGSKQGALSRGVAGARPTRAE